PLSAGGPLWLPNQEEHYWEYAKRIHRSALSWREKWLCYQVIPIVCYWSRLKKLGGAWKRRLRRGSPRPVPGSPLYDQLHRSEACRAIGAPRIAMDAPRKSAVLSHRQEETRH